MIELGLFLLICFGRRGIGLRYKIIVKADNTPSGEFSYYSDNLDYHKTHIQFTDDKGKFRLFSIDMVKEVSQLGGQ